MSTCTRCAGEHLKTITMWNARPGGHTRALLQPDYEPPKAERVCGNCLTDREIMLQLGPVADFAISALIKDASENPSPNEVECLIALELARSFFRVRNNNPDNNNRRAAIRALGLETA